MHYKYHYCAYWNKWSRVLRWGDSVNSQVEIDLEPINDTEEGWRKVGEVHVRAHITAPGDRDLAANKLPDELLIRMAKNLGLQTRDKLLRGKFLSKIDWEKYRKVCNGGAPLSKISR